MFATTKVWGEKAGALKRGERVTVDTLSEYGKDSIRLSKYVKEIDGAKPKETYVLTF